MITPVPLWFVVPIVNLSALSSLALREWRISCCLRTYPPDMLPLPVNVFRIESPWIMSTFQLQRAFGTGINVGSFTDLLQCQQTGGLKSKLCFKFLGYFSHLHWCIRGMTARAVHESEQVIIWKNALNTSISLGSRPIWVNFSGETDVPDVETAAFESEVRYFFDIFGFLAVRQYLCVLSINPNTSASLAWLEPVCFFDTSDWWSGFFRGFGCDLFPWSFSSSALSGSLLRSSHQRFVYLFGFVRLRWVLCVKCASLINFHFCTNQREGVNVSLVARKHIKPLNLEYANTLWARPFDGCQTAAISLSH